MMGIWPSSTTPAVQPRPYRIQAEERAGSFRIRTFARLRPAACSLPVQQRYVASDAEQPPAVTSPGEQPLNKPCVPHGLAARLVRHRHVLLRVAWHTPHPWKLCTSRCVCWCAPLRLLGTLFFASCALEPTGEHPAQMRHLHPAAALVPRA